MPFPHQLRVRQQTLLGEPDEEAPVFWGGVTSILRRCATAAATAPASRRIAAFPPKLPRVVLLQLPVLVIFGPRG
jgi:hypothetical protein